MHQAEVSATVESNGDLARRNAWIMYYIRVGELPKAFALGWDGSEVAKPQMPDAAGGANQLRYGSQCMRAVPQQTQVEVQADVELKEPEDVRTRRVQWIRYYVRTNEPHKAYDLGWDGEPFRV